MNSYAYVHSDPLRFRDDYGLQVGGYVGLVGTRLAIGAIAGGLTSAGVQYLIAGQVNKNQVIDDATAGALLGLLNPAASFAPGLARASLGDLTRREIAQIQKVVDQACRPIDVVGSAARGSRRGLGTNLPIGKGDGTRSDIDYLIGPSSRAYFDDFLSQLPSMDTRTGPIYGTPNPFIGPSIRFEPGAPPRFIPGQ